jgi:hypothetical protein
MLMLEFAKFPLDERTPYLQEVANRRGLSLLVVEKDFWVCLILRLLFTESGLADKIVFKGGTSLSKVFNIIKRFSEDIDISIDPDWLGFGGDDRPDAAESRSQFDKRWEKLNKACAAVVEEKIQSSLELAIKEVIGPSATGQTHLTFKLEEQTQSPLLTFRYPTNEPASPGYIHPQVKLELGSLTDQRPIGNYNITPWIAEEFPGMFKESECRVVALEAERTFWEKATILHTEYHRPREKPMRNRLSRDCYDLCCMAKHGSGRRALADLALLQRVVEHKRIYFYSSWASYDTAPAVPTGSTGEAVLEDPALEKPRYNGPTMHSPLRNRNSIVGRNGLRLINENRHTIRASR